MAKERSINPAQAQRKIEKAKAIKKSKAEAVTRRNEKLARRNPDRLQKQLDELKAIETSGGKLTNHEKNLLDSFEKELHAVRKARESLGINGSRPASGPSKNDGDKPHSRLSERERERGYLLGKRRRENSDSSDDSDVPDDVKKIPMPKDTPPPIPKEVLDRWYQKRRERMGIDFKQNNTNANLEPLGNNGKNIGNTNRDANGGITPAPIVQAQTVYEAKPVIRDLRKEAVAFIPAVVREKMDKTKGVGSLAEPEELDKLETAGYLSKEKS